MSEASIASFDVNKVIAKSAYNVERDELLAYYHEVYKHRLDTLPFNWEWQNRTDFINKNGPLLLEYNGKVIGHLGMMPFQIIVGDKTLHGQWLIDFSIHPDYRRLGLGNVITKAWMELADVNVTCCNYKAIEIFKKIGWRAGANSHILFLFIKPFNHPRIGKKMPIGIKKIANTAFLILNWVLCRMFGSPKVNVSELKEHDLYRLSHKINNTEKLFFGGVRDYNFFKWRLLESPDRKHYRLVEIDGKYALIKLMSEDRNYVDLLFIDRPATFKQMLKIHASIGLWSLNEGYDYVRSFSSDIKLTKYLKSKLLMRTVYHHYAFHSSNQSLMDQIAEMPHIWDLGDSDFEKYYPHHQ
ncbi:MAG: GNAT family N-acetyltransferase [Bacteroidetes bacterium]|nr:GNAT family N-acetyltransferase [Bacteroidota bacterium]